MAAIDKLYTNFWDYRELVVWCLIHKPSLLKNMYDPFMPKWENLPDDAEVRIFPDWVHDFNYMPIEGTGYLESFNMIIIKPKYAD